MPGGHTLFWPLQDFQTGGLMCFTGQNRVLSALALIQTSVEKPAHTL